jgi:putative methyltransferase (TIGR04325 family)
MDKSDYFVIWDGMYPDFKSAIKDTSGEGFTGDIYRERSLSAALESLQLLETGESIPQFHKQRVTNLPPIIALLLKIHTKISILDFGGGLGIGYMSLVESLGSDVSRIEYTILELEEVCDHGESLLGKKVRYTSTFPKEQFDLVLAASSLQYVEDWRNALREMTFTGTQYILLSDVFAGRINPFVTLQNYYGSKIPQWFLNFEELVQELDQLGYELIMKSNCPGRRLDSIDILPMQNFPVDSQIRETLNLLFAKK